MGFGKTLEILFPCDMTSLHVELESKIFGVKQGVLSVAKWFVD